LLGTNCHAATLCVEFNSVLNCGKVTLACLVQLPARECAGCDILLHEVYSAVGLPKAPPQMQRYHPTAHTSTYELAEIAAKAKPKLLVLYHQLYLGGVSDDDLVREVRSKYDGRVVSAHDLDFY
jgi:ribonuclease BN (tRNA processing enzyme)